MTHHWLEYPLARFDAGAPHWDPPLSAGLQSTEHDGEMILGYQTPLTTPPLSFNSFELDSAPLSRVHSTTSLHRGAESTQASFIQYDPRGISKGDMPISCIPCYMRHRRCKREADVNICNHCLGQSGYCTGPIKTPSLLDNDSWFDLVLTSMALPREPPASKMNLQMSLVGFPRAIIDYSLDIRELRGPWNRRVVPDLGRLLDTVLPGLPGLPSKSVLAKQECFANFETCCRRFIACLGLLGKPGSCTLDVSQWEEYYAPYALLSFVRHVSDAAGSSFMQIFNALKEFLLLPRKSNDFRERICSLAYHLGLVHQSIQSFALSEEAWCHRFPTFRGLFSGIETALSQLNHLGMGLDPKRFRVGCRAVLPLCEGIYLSSSVGPLVQADWKSAVYTQQQTFLETLDHCHSWKANTTAQTPNTPTLNSEPVSDLSCGIGPALHNTLEEALADWTSSFFPVIDPPLSSNSDKWSLENYNIQNLPLWEQQLAEVCEKEALLRDQIAVANNYRATRQAKYGRDTEAGPLNGTIAGGDSLQSSYDGLILIASGAKQAQSSYSAQVTVPSYSCSEKSLIESNFDVAMIDESLCLPVSEESIQFNTTLMPVMNSRSSREFSWQPSPKFEGGTRGQKRRRLSEKHLPVIHQNTPTTLTLGQSTSHGLPVSAASKQEWEQPEKGHRRNRLSRMLFGQPSTLQLKPQITDGAGAASLVPSSSMRSPRSQRPVSYPQSQRWRKSLNVSVRALREGFEKLKTV